jgi:K+-transporting ATPase ATPase C chain
MLQHLYRCLVLLLVSVLVCTVLYPLALLGIGQTLFRDKADGSMVRNVDGKAIGSRLIAQAFKGEQYFQPRPSAADYNAAASGATNWGASNPLLRDRVAQSLGPIVKYAKGPKLGKLAGDDVVQWFQEQVKDDGKAEVEKRFVPTWANDHSSVAEQWIKNNAEAVGAWIGKDDKTVKAESGDVVKTFFKEYAAKHPGTWPSVVDEEIEKGKTAKRIKPATDGPDVQANLFDPWLQAHPAEAGQLELVPADLVMASGSGLDPHITLANARFQLDRVAEAWAAKTKADKEQVRRAIDKLLEEKAEAPLGGLAGVPLVNVLEVNLALEGRLAAPLRTSR